MTSTSVPGPAATPETPAGTPPLPGRVPVLVVGAGLGGLSTAVALGLDGVESLVVERHPGTSNQPKARGQMAHTMEALRVAGLEDAVRDAGYDLGTPMEIVIGSTVTGEPLHTLVENLDFDLSGVTPAKQGMASQERAEPILARRAVELGASVRFRTTLESFAQDADGVTSVLVDATGERHTVRSDFLVAGDGWRTDVRPALGIGTHGRGSLAHMLSAVFLVDLGERFAGREFLLVYLQNPALHGGNGAFATTDDAGRYTMMFEYDPDAGERFEDFTREQVIEQIRIGLGLPDAEIDLLSTAPTEFGHRIADRFCDGRVVLVGDAAHVMPPTGGQGGNTAVNDGFHLGWKLAAVVNGQAGLGLVATYDTERRPYGEFIAGQQLTNYVVRMAPQFRDGTEDEEANPFHGMLGFRYSDGAFVREPEDGWTQLEDPAAPTARPGSRAPHVWLERDGERISTIDLYGHGFVLLTASPAWTAAAAEVADRLGVPLTVAVTGAGGLVDPEGRVPSAYGIGADGAALVRPDRVVAWRTPDAASADDLEKALRTVLFR